LSDRDRTSTISREAANLNVAWKTGTSSGNRDAWCAAVTPRRTVVVWLGNAGGQSSPALVGRDAAAPLALALIAALDPVPAEWPSESGEIVRATPRPSRSRFAIVSPAPAREIVISDDVPADRQRVPLQSAGGSAGGVVHWFADGNHLGSASAASPLWWTPTPGPHALRAVDAAGRAASCSVRVTGPRVAGR
jgi:membrane carboxypeptidase/penicillin-binding protein PbpC